MTVSVHVTKLYKHPGFKLPADVYRRIGKLAIVGSIIDNVLKQKQADGSGLKANPPGYRAQKRARGWAVGGVVRALVAGEHRFTSAGSWLVTATTSGVKVRPRGAKFRDIIANVQERGYVGWFDINPTGLLAIRKMMRQFILKQLSKAQG